MVCLNSYAFYALDTFILRVSINLCHNEDIIEGSFVAVFEHALEIVAVVVCAGHGTVDVCADDDQIVSFCVIVADMELTFDGLFCLPFRTVSRINNGSFHKCAYLLFLRSIVG